MFLHHVLRISAGMILPDAQTKINHYSHQLLGVWTIDNLSHKV